MKVLFLDDDPKRQKAFRAECPQATIVSTAQLCIEAIRRETWDVIFLDHDLNGETYVDSSREDCGMEVVRNMCGEILKSNAPFIRQPTVIVHSYNDHAARAMVHRLSQSDYEAAQLPFQLVGFNTFVAGIQARQ